MRSIWEDEIGIKGIDANDDFFELGGHSMVAIKVMTRIEKATGCRLPIASFFETPTILQLAKKIALNEKPAFQKKVVVPVKVTGSKTPIFFVHAGGLNILLYKAIARYLDVDQPLYGLQGLGMDGDTTYLTSIETIAARYLAEVQEYWPNGPYIIMGYSYGGVIAYEMSRQLLVQGKEVLLLGILDTYVSSSWYPQTAFQKQSKKIVRQFKKLAFLTKNLIIYPKETVDYQWYIINRKFNKNYKRPVANQVQDYPANTVDAYDNAYHNYQIKPLDVAIRLFKVKKRIYFVDDLKYLGWKPYALKGVQVSLTPGDHRTFMLSPNNEVLAKLIQAAVNNLSLNATKPG